MVVLYGPKAVGKTQIARLLERDLGVHYVDCDVLVADAVAAGKEPDPNDGWLAEVEAALRTALAESDTASLEATGAWPSDWRLAEDLVALGHHVVRVWVSTAWPTSLERLRNRTEPRVAVSEHDAETIYLRASSAASGEVFDLRIDTTEPLDEGQLRRDLGSLLI